MLSIIYDRIAVFADTEKPFVITISSLVCLCQAAGHSLNNSGQGMLGSAGPCCSTRACRVVRCYAPITCPGQQVADVLLSLCKRSQRLFRYHICVPLVGPFQAIRLCQVAQVFLSSGRGGACNGDREAGQRDVSGIGRGRHAAQVADEGPEKLGGCSAEGASVSL